MEVDHFSRVILLKAIKDSWQGKPNVLAAIRSASARDRISVNTATGDAPFFTLFGHHMAPVIVQAFRYSSGEGYASGERRQGPGTSWARMWGMSSSLRQRRRSTLHPKPWQEVFCWIFVLRDFCKSCNAEFAPKVVNARVVKAFANNES